MKKIITAAVSILLTFTLSAQEGRSIYNRYSDAENVSAVYISPAMFRIMGKLPEMNLSGNDVPFSSIVKSLNGFYLIESKNSSINASLKADAEKMIRSGRYELLMEAKDNGQTVHIYISGDEQTVVGLVMFVYEKDSVTFINIDGNMSRAKLEKLIADSASDTQ